MSCAKYFPSAYNECLTPTQQKDCQIKIMAIFLLLLSFLSEFNRSTKEQNKLPQDNRHLEFPNCYSHTDYFYSAASLQHVVEITTCRRRIGTYTAIVGLLLRYASGHRASVGEFRMDCIGETLRVDITQNLYLGFARAEKIPPHVARLELSSPGEKMGPLHWLCMGWTGKLEWWFHFGHSKLYYGDQESPSLFS